MNATIATETRNGGSLRRMVGPTREMKIKALEDMRGWTTEAAHSAGDTYSDLVEERADTADQREAWRIAYAWVDGVLFAAQRKLRRPNDRAKP